MPTEKQAREALISAFEHLKDHHNALLFLMAEVAAIRESLIDIGPKYKQVLSKFRKKHEEETYPSVADDLQRFDDIIQKLKRLP